MWNVLSAFLGVSATLCSGGGHLMRDNVNDVV